MKDKINIAELLKDCPTGMELDCTMFENIEFDHIDENNATYSIICCVKTEWGGYNVHTFTEHGCYRKETYSKCVIFPKGKTTWKGFVPPCKFKDGDIIADNYGNVGIYKGGMCYDRKLADYYCGYRKYDDKFLIKEEKDRHFGCITELRPATEEEKEKLFQAIKDNGYKWNAETKTLEKLVEPKFKVGDIVRSKNCINAGNFIIVGVEENSYSINIKNYCIEFKDQDNYELVHNKFDITTLKPFDKVLARCSTLEKWRIQLFEKYDKTCKYPFICMGYNKYKECIPYEGNEHLLDTINDCDEFYKTWE